MISRKLARRFGNFQPAVLPDLTYDYGDLTPAVSARIMELHHSKHHQTYVNNYNAAVEKLISGAEAGNTQAVQALNSAIRFNGGGHVNHTLFWENLASASREGGSLPDADSQFSQAITETFGGYDQFISQFNTQTVAVQGSGWGWLVLNDQNNLEILDLKDQDTVTENGRTPLLGVDVWEHAYYLDYENLRPKYLENIW
jgi:Fe-Mn family superoxide dismutase